MEKPHKNVKWLLGLTKKKWFSEVSWSWSGSSNTHGRAGSRKKFHSSTITVTHKPSHVTLTKTTPYVENKREKIWELEHALFWQAFWELEQEMVRRGVSTD